MSNIKLMCRMWVFSLSLSTLHGTLAPQRGHALPVKPLKPSETMPQSKEKQRRIRCMFVGTVGGTVLVTLLLARRVKPCDNLVGFMQSVKKLPLHFLQGPQGHGGTPPGNNRGSSPKAQTPTVPLTATAPVEFGEKSNEDIDNKSYVNWKATLNCGDAVTVQVRINCSGYISKKAHILGKMPTRVGDADKYAYLVQYSDASYGIVIETSMQERNGKHQYADPVQSFVPDSRRDMTGDSYYFHGGALYIAMKEPNVAMKEPTEHRYFMKANDLVWRRTGTGKSAQDCTTGTFVRTILDETEYHGIVVSCVDPVYGNRRYYLQNGPETFHELAHNTQVAVIN